MTTGRSLVTTALTEAGVLTGGETPTSQEVVDGLATLNRMLSSWSNESLMIYARVLENFPLQGGVREYTIGPAATFNTVRPMHIIDAFVRQDTIDYPVDIIPDEAYDNIAFKSNQSIPEVLNYSAGYPTALIRLYPNPIASLTLYIRSEKQLAEITLNDDISLPPGWEDALVYNLAVRLKPSYGLPADPVLIELALNAKVNLETNTSRNRTFDYAPRRDVGWIMNGWLIS